MSLKSEIIKEKITKSILIDAKNKVQTVIDFLKEMEKKFGSTKESKMAIMTMTKFLNCHINNSAIYKRYQEVMILMERYANGIKS